MYLCRQKERESMETKSNKFIAVTYELYTVDGEERHLVEKAPADKPFYFISGFGVAIDEFEKAVIDLAKGDSFDFTLTK
jgi:FKBP-type peptidyl-prolyl cis-trans isomerase SlyD